MGRYKVMTGEFADLMLGYYGETIGPRSRQVIDRAAKQAGKPPINGRPADLLKPEWQELRTAACALKGSNGSDEDVLTYALFPQVAPKFFSTREQGPRNLGKDPSAPAPSSSAPAPAAENGNGGKGPVKTPVTYEVKLNGRTHRVTVAPA
jgi:methylmalonyl-CoA carboxyltransferase 5S subunit